MSFWYSFFSWQLQTLSARLQCCFTILTLAVAGTVVVCTSWRFKALFWGEAPCFPSSMWQVHDTREELQGKTWWDKLVSAKISDILLFVCENVQFPPLLFASPQTPPNAGSSGKRHGQETISESANLWEELRLRLRLALLVCVCQLRSLVPPQFCKDSLEA